MTLTFDKQIEHFIAEMENNDIDLQAIDGAIDAELTKRGKQDPANWRWAASQHQDFADVAEKEDYHHEQIHFQAETGYHKGVAEGIELAREAA